ncbi:MAG TPA: hypothetical protein VMS96_15155 [Terriglobales bacterium]|nr:hypothetical protein [Terriglobales bacterium]
MQMLVISLVLQPAAGADPADAGQRRQRPTVDGLFMSLILLAIAGVFLLNAGVQARALGLAPRLGKKLEGAKA